ncbi:MAG: tRNA lysidine(34) synthetase TilS, partial [Candidatus Gastranaerophilales bacterium]|nr:tRNA lysidine(34) synthetase TilS [Candidatus Gastranaerophilales bacterium]
MKEKVKDPIITHIADFLKKHGLFEKENCLLVAFSGGVDSLCMLDVLHELSENAGFRLVAAHLNHNWRGEESIREAENAKAYCEEQGITFYTETLPEGLPQTEESARNQRYDFLNRAAVKYKATAILTAHTKTDQVETVLYRIIKGTGISGLRGIPAVRHQKSGLPIYRPLLRRVERADCERYCAENRLIPNSDSSNFNEKYLRNRIRLSLLPELRTYNPSVDEALFRLSEVAVASEEIIREYTKNLRREVMPDEGIILTTRFLSLSSAVQKLILIGFLEVNNIEYGFERVEELAEFIRRNADSKTGKRLSIGKNQWFVVSSENSRVIMHEKSQKPPVLLPIVDEGQFFHTRLRVCLKVQKWKDEPVKTFPDATSNVIFADLSRVKGRLVLRARQAGDVIQPFGMQGKMKLKKYLINRRIPEYLRDEIPLLTDGNEVLWVVGVGTSELIRVTGLPTHKIVVEKM